jgi:hypothetical protein
MIMIGRWRNIITLTAVVAMIVANCYAPRFVHAYGSLEHAALSVESHAHGASAEVPCHSQDDDKGENGEAGASKFCCAAACAATALIWNSSVLPHQSPVGRSVSAALTEFLQSIAWHSIDPPPRAA